jgi:hypothetical protein
VNCKPNDLAVIVHSAAGNEGKIVRCIRLATEMELREAAVTRMYGPVWLIDPSVPHSIGGIKPYATDVGLRPIRPGDISDEEVRDLYAPKLPEAA